MKALFAVLVLFAACFSVSLGSFGVDVSLLTSQSSFACLKNNGFDYAIVRAFQADGHFDPNAPPSIQNAWAAGIPRVDVYMFPCPSCGNPAGQVSLCLSSLQSVRFGILWLDIEGPQYWNGNPSANQAFFAALVAQAIALGARVGVYTSKSQWEVIMGPMFFGGSGLPLWYAHYDNNPSFSDFVPFGGWTKPAMKQYNGDANACGTLFDKNFYP